MKQDNTIVNLMFYKNKRDSLKSICHEQIRRLYYNDKKDLAMRRFEYEYEMLMKIPGGEKAFLETAEYLKKIQNVCTCVHGYEPVITFRGAVMSSFIAYLIGIIRDDPLKTDLEPWVFYERKRVIEFNVDITIRTYKVIKNYEIIPPYSVVLRIGRDSSIIEIVEESIAYKMNASINGDVISSFFNKVAHEDLQKLRFFTGFDERYVPYVFSTLEKLREYRQLPKDLSELSLLDGFLHSTLKDKDYLHALDMAYKSGDGNIYDFMISSVEDVYHKLLDSGCDKTTAKRIAVITMSRKKRLGYEDMLNTVYNLGENYMEMLINIEHLFSKCQCYQNSIQEEKLMYLICNHPDAVSEAYEEACSFLSDCFKQ